MIEFLSIKNGAKLERFEHNDIVYIKADGNNSDILLVETNNLRPIYMQLGQIAQLIKDQMIQTGTDFIRVGKSYIVNRNYISTVDVTNEKLILTYGGGFSNEYDIFEYTKYYDKDNKKHIEKALYPGFYMRKTTDRKNIELTDKLSREALIKLRDELLKE